MNLYNPYEPPRDGGVPLADAAPGDPTIVPDHIVELMRQTRPWVTFLAIVGFLGTGLMVLGGLAVLAMGAITPKFPAAIGLIYIVPGVMLLFPSIRLIQFGQSIGRLVADPHMERLAVAVGHQKSYWKLVGIMAAVTVAMYPVLIVGAVVFAIAKR